MGDQAWFAGLFGLLIPGLHQGRNGFQGTRSRLVMWFRAPGGFTGQKNGDSALGLQRILGLGSYGTAWTWLYAFRRAMVRPGRDRLAGRVEVETYLGGLEEGVYGRGTHKKALTVVVP